MGNEKQFSLSEKTLVPLSLIATICGGVVWVTMLYAQGVSNAKSIDELRTIQNSYAEDLSAMKVDISFIRGVLERKNGHK